MSEPTYAGRVAAGVAVLDEQVPGWEQRINLQQLNLNHCNLCVLGQLYHDVTDPVAYLGEARVLGILGRLGDLGFDMTDAEELRFDAGDGSNPVYEGLTAEWVRVIEARRSA
jgi:hypothetical protein